MGRLDGRVAVITGAAQGIGLATAKRLASEGATVAVLDLDENRTRAAVAEIQTTKARVVGFSCDVSDRASVETAIGASVAQLGRLDILVNSAGITRDNLIQKMSEPDWDDVLDVNLKGTFLTCAVAQRHMVAARSGSIVNLSSRSALGNRGQANYSAAKAGIRGLTATLAIDLGPLNVRVNAVAPGYVATAMTAATAQRVGVSVEQHQRAVAERTPLQRVAAPEEIAAVVAFLASDDASYVTGQTIFVNGGAR